MSFTTEEEWTAAYAAAEDVLRLHHETQRASLDRADIAGLARQVATAVIRSQHYDGDDIALTPTVQLEEVNGSPNRDPLVKDMQGGLIRYRNTAGVPSFSEWWADHRLDSTFDTP